MTVVSLPLDPGSEARTHPAPPARARRRGRPRRRRPDADPLAVDDRLLERLLTFDAGAEDLEEAGDERA